MVVNGEEGMNERKLPENWLFQTPCMSRLLSFPTYSKPVTIYYIADLLEKVVGARPVYLWTSRTCPVPISRTLEI